MIQQNLIATTLFSVILRANAFTYKDAANWGQKYKQCNGKNQSPIFLRGEDMSFPVFEKNLKFTNFNKLPTNVTIKNTGHTVEVKANWSGKPPLVTGGPLHGKYVFEKSTFHWAEKPYTMGHGAENDPLDAYSNYTVDMEVHMFFYKKDLKSFEKAQKQKGGLAVLNVAFSAGYVEPEHFFDTLEKNVHLVKSPNSAAVIPPFRLLSLIGDNRYIQNFDFYEGSLDYPPCYETVSWFIYEFVFPFSKNLVKEFRKIKLSGGDTSNFRPTQNQNQRKPKMIDATNGKDE